MEEFVSVFDYDTVLEEWAGPMDLLLHLVKRAEIEIKDIFVSNVTEQFLAYVDKMGDIDLERVCSYLTVAANLVELKSKALLPLEEDEMEELENEQQEFIQRLEEYKLLKEAGQKLKEQEDINKFYKKPDKNAHEVKFVYNDFFNLDALIQAFSKMMLKVDSENRSKTELKEIPRESYTVKEKVVIIVDALKEKEYISFFELFNNDTNKDELITTFQAMLELLKLQQIEVEQNGIFEDITLKLREDRDEVIGEIDEYN